MQEPSPDEPLDWITNALDRIGGGTADRAFRACKAALRHYGVECDISLRYAHWQGTIPRRQLDGMLGRLAEELHKVAAAQVVTVFVPAMGIYFVSPDEAVICVSYAEEGAEDVGTC